MKNHSFASNQYQCSPLFCVFYWFFFLSAFRCPFHSVTIIFSFKYLYIYLECFLISLLFGCAVHTNTQMLLNNSLVSFIYSKRSWTLIWVTLCFSLSLSLSLFSFTLELNSINQKSWIHHRIIWFILHRLFCRQI